MTSKKGNGKGKSNSNGNSYSKGKGSGLAGEGEGGPEGGLLGQGGLSAGEGDLEAVVAKVGDKG